MICKHYYYFTELKSETNNLLDRENWDILRMNSVKSPFSIEKNTKEYEENNKKAENKSYADMAKIMCEKLLKDSNCVASLGVGKGILEWHIKQINTSLKVDCADYTVNSINQLKKVFTLGDDFFVFDMLKDDWKSLNGYDCVILYRMSTEFDKNTWEILFKKMYDAKIDRIIFVPTGLDNIRTMCVELISHYCRCLKGKKDCFCGWLYSENEFLSMWKKYYEIADSVCYESTKLYHLKRIEKCEMTDMQRNNLG